MSTNEVRLRGKDFGHGGPPSPFLAGIFLGTVTFFLDVFLVDIVAKNRSINTDKTKQSAGLC